MPSAAALRVEIERSLAHRFPAALTPAPTTIREVAATGIREVDEMLEGGLPVGAISELTGAQSSGRTSLALAFLAGRTAEGRACAWVDVNDTFDPESAAANGVALRQLLWVRCNDAGVQTKPRTKTKPQTKPWTKLDQALRATDLLLQAGGFAAIVLDLGGTAREHGNRIPAATWFRFRHAADHTSCSLVVLGKAAYAQSSAALVLECRRGQEQTAGGTVLRGFVYAVERKRERWAAVVSITRESGSPTTGDPKKRFVLLGEEATGPGRWGGKPPASTWQAHPAWEAEKRDPHGEVVVHGVQKRA
jgi:recombination protein RecA